MTVFVGDDWAEAHHDVHLMTEAGDRLSARRLPEGLEGIAAFHAMVAEHAGDASEVVVGIGGGSVVDAGKAIAAMARQPGELLDYLEVVGKGRSLDEVPLPFIAVPTTAGTGAEVTRNAVIGVPEHLSHAAHRHLSVLCRARKRCDVTVIEV